jgi:hypothetical protein
MGGFDYAGTISVGFAGMENPHNVTELDCLQQLARTAALAVTHVLSAPTVDSALATPDFTFAVRSPQSSGKLAASR